MPILTNILSIPLNGTGTEIPALSVSDPYEGYEFTGTVTTTGNYTINPTGSPQAGTTYIFDYNAVLDITTNSNTFSIFGISLNQTQLLSKLQIICRYNGSAWKVKITGSLDQATITSGSIANNAVITTKLNANAVTNAKLAQMAAYTVKANNTGSTADPQDVYLNVLAWGLTGNSGTTPGTNFIGTLDAQDLVFKVNSTIAGRITNLNSNVSYGKGSLSSITVGLQNVAIGGEALSDVTSGENNVGIGAGALGFVTTGVGNTGIGVSAQTLTTGSNNTIIGDGADVSSANSQSRIALGVNANATTNYQFALPDDVINIKWRGQNYVLPSTAPSANAFLKSDSSGNLSWGTL